MNTFVALKTPEVLQPSEKSEAQRTIYVVDDDSGIRKSTSLLFRSLGFEHWPYASGVDFLANISYLKPGCVLLDVRMPFVNGLDVLEKLGSANGRFPTVVMTGHGDVETAVKAMKLGAIDFIEKPFEEAVLMGAVQNAFDSIRRNRAPVQGKLGSEAIEKLLTKRQREVLAGMVEGLSNKLIAQKMCIAPRTVEMHRANLMTKLEAKNLAEVLRLALPLRLSSLADSSVMH